MITSSLMTNLFAFNTTIQNLSWLDQTSLFSFNLRLHSISFIRHYLRFPRQTFRLLYFPLLSFVSCINISSFISLSLVLSLSSAVKEISYCALIAIHLIIKFSFRRHWISMGSVFCTYFIYIYQIKWFLAWLSHVIKTRNGEMNSGFRNSLWWLLCSDFLSFVFYRVFFSFISCLSCACCAMKVRCS